MTDRPDQTESASIVPLYRMQVETGIMLEWQEKAEDSYIINGVFQTIVPRAAQSPAGPFGGHRPVGEFPQRIHRRRTFMAYPKVGLPSPGSGFSGPSTCRYML